VCHDAGVNPPDESARAPWLSPPVIGLLCGATAALFWAISLVSALHGISIGLTPLEIALHRFVWVGLAFLPFARRGRAADIVGVGWGRSIALTLSGAVLLALFSNAGFLLVPLGHGGVIQPSTAALSGLILATIVFKEHVYPSRAIGGLALVAGLCTIGYEAIATIGLHGILGDLAFAAAGLSFAIFGVLLKLWSIPPIKAVAITSVLSLAVIPIEYFTSGFQPMIAAGFRENLILALVQSGFLATYLFTRAVVLLGAAKAAVFPALVPPFTLMTGYLFLGNVPTALQLVGLVMVLTGFRLTQKS
jgi:drug/metabolite transporter (DMT)-like permease